MPPTPKPTQAPVPGSPVSVLPGVGPARALKLGRLEVHTLADLIRHLPMRYEDESAEGFIEDLPMDGKTVGSARGVLNAVRWVPGAGRGRKGRFQATLQDDSGTLSLVWFNQGFLRDVLNAGQPLRVQGKTKRYDGYPQMVNAVWEKLADPEDEPTRVARLRPVYPATDGVNSKTIERLVTQALDQLKGKLVDPLPTSLAAAHNMPPLVDAFHMVHQPKEADDHKAARRRLAFNELILLQLGIAMKRAYVEKKQVAPALKITDTIDNRIRKRFGFDLTKSQDAVIAEIVSDVTKSAPMNRLVQGDVGSGKTVVALYAMLMAVRDGRQATLMAPTELLAEQHFASISQMLKGSNVNIRLMTGGQSTAGSKARKALLDEIASGQADIVIGTQALVSGKVIYKDLALVVIDEQHRFGVMQRAQLRASDERDDNGRLRVPHQLIMTATPIPRTLSLTIFGDLDVSTITGKPPGRVPIESRVVMPYQADTVYEYLQTRLDRGEQAYVVVPAIDAGDASDETILKSVSDHAKKLRQVLSKGMEVAEVHGRMPREDREKAMQRFRNGQAHVLVATTVIEVGVDVPNASVMIIEHAERFGLSQLHQLRGRIGREASTRRPLCVFIADPKTDEAIDRMNAIAATNDGFKIAEEDLRIRGMGDFFGTRQSGMPPLRVAQIPEDLDLLTLARDDAQRIITQDWLLTDPNHKLLRKVLLQQYGQALGLIDVG